jgi:ABC-2 type transport system permease protein
MSAESNAVPQAQVDAQAKAPAETRPFYWSVRRELWENRSIYLAPLAVAGVGVLGYVISLAGLPKSMRELGALNPAHQRVALAMPYAHAAMALLLTGFLVGVFYCLETLHGERRDRTILFWKSLPVSDLTTVLAKASVPLVVLPLVIFLTVVALQLIMLVLSSVVLMVSGVGAAIQWDGLELFQMEVVLLYGLAVLALWHAPLYGWLLLVSGWARRATFLWFVLPLAAIVIFEAIAFHTAHFARLLGDRLYGFAPEAFAFTTPDGALVDPHFIPLAALTPGKFLSTPGLWIGLIFAAGFLFAAVRMRRYREPI